MIYILSLRLRLLIILLSLYTSTLILFSLQDRVSYKIYARRRDIVWSSVPGPGVYAEKRFDLFKTVQSRERARQRDIENEKSSVSRTKPFAFVLVYVHSNRYEIGHE